MSIIVTFPEQNIMKRKAVWGANVFVGYQLGATLISPLHFLILLFKFKHSTRGHVFSERKFS